MYIYIHIYIYMHVYINLHEWCMPVPPMCVLAPPIRTVHLRVYDDGSDLMLPLQNQ